MKINKSVFRFIAVSLSLSMSFANPSGTFADVRTVTGGIIPIEDNATYMIPLGSQDGVRQNDSAEVFRGDKKIADIRLISVLAGSSIGQVMNMIDSGGIQQTDTVKFSPDSSEQNAVAAISPDPVLLSNENTSVDDGEVESAAISAESSANERQRLEQEQEQSRRKRSADTAEQEREIRQQLMVQADETKILKEELSDRQSMMQSLIKESADLKQQIIQKDRRLEELKSNVEDLIGKLNLAQTQVEKQRMADEAKFISLREEHTEKLVKQENATRDRMLDQETRLTEKIKELESKVYDLDQDKLQFNDQIKSKESMVQALMEERARLRGEVDALNGRISQMIEEHTTDFLKQNQEQEKKTREQSKEVQDKMTALETELAAVKKNYQLEVQALQNNLTQKEALLDALQKDKNALRVDVIARDQKLSDLNVAQESALAEMKSWSDKAGFLEGELKTLKETSQIREEGLKNSLDEKNGLLQSLVTEKESLLSAVNEKDQRLAYLQETVEQIRGQLKKSQETSESLEKELSILRTTALGKTAELVGELNQKEAAIDALKQERATFLTRVDEKDKQLADMGAMVEKIGAELKAALGKADLLNNELNSVRMVAGNEAGALKAELDKKTVILESLNKDKASLQNEIKIRDNKLSDMTAETGKLLAELKKVRGNADQETAVLKKALDERQSLLKSIGSERDALLAERESKDKTLADFNAGSEKLHADLKAAQERTEFLEKELDAVKKSAQAQAAALQKESEERQALVQALSGQKESLQNQIKEKDQKLLETDEIANQLRLGLKALQDKTWALEGELNVVKTSGRQEIDKLQTQLEQKETLLKSLDKDKEFLAADFKNNEKALADAKAEAEKLRAELKKTQDRIALLENDLKAGKAGAESQAVVWKDNLAKQEALIKSLDKEKKSLEAGIKERDKKLADLGAETARMQGDLKKTRGDMDIELASLKSALKEKEALLKSVDQDRGALSKGLEDKNKKITEADAAAEKLRAELKKAQDQALSLQNELTAVRMSSQKDTATLKARLDQSETLLKSLDKDKSGLLESIQHQEKKLADAAGEAARLAAELKKAQEEFGFIDGKFGAFRAGAQAEAAALKTQLEQKELLIKAMDQDKVVFSTDLQSKNKILADISAEAEKLRAELKKVQAQALSLENELTALRMSSQKDTATLKARLDQSETLLKSLDKDKSGLLESIQHQEKKLAAAAAELKKAQEESGSVDGEFNAFRAGAKAEIAALKAQLEQKELLIKAMDQDKTAFLMDLQGKNKILADISAEAEKLRAEWKKAQDRTALLENDLNAARAKTESQTVVLKNDLVKKESLLKDFDKEKQTLLSAIKDQDKKFSDLTAEMMRIQADLKKTRDDAAVEIASLKSALQEKESLLKSTDKDRDVLLKNLEERNKASADATTEIGRARAELKRAQDHIAFLENESNQLKINFRKEADASSGKLAQQEALLQNLDKDKDDLLAGLQEKTRRLAEADAAAEKTRVELKKAQDHIAFLEDESNQLKISVRKEADALKIKLNQQEEFLKNLDQNKDDLLAGLQEKSRRLAEADAAAEKTRVELKKAQDHIAFLENESNQLKINFRKEADASSGKLAQHEALLQNLDKDKADLLAGLQEKTRRLAEADAAAEKARADLKAAQDQVLFLQNELNASKMSLQTQIITLKGELDQQQFLFKSLEKDKADLMAGLQDKDKKFAAVDSETESVRAELRKARNQVALLEEELEQKEALLNGLDKNKGSLSAELQDKEKRLTDASMEIERMRAELKRAQERAGSMEGEFNALRARSQSEAAVLKGELDKKETALQSLDDQKDLLNAQLKDYQAKAASLQEELVRVRMEVPQKEKQIVQVQEDLKKELKEKESRIGALTEENAWLKQNIDRMNQLVIRMNKDASESRRTALPAVSDRAPLRDISDDFSTGEKISSQYGGPQTWDEYYSVIRSMILGRLSETDLTPYIGRTGEIKVEFEVAIDGSLKDSLQFYGTNDPELRKLLQESFNRASPFPKFPVNLAETSKIFAIVIEF